jgi:hypothetical protein
MISSEIRQYREVAVGETVLAHLILRGRQLVTITRIGTADHDRLLMCYQEQDREYSFAVSPDGMVAVVVEDT